MYTAPWCGTCRRAHQFFESNGLPVTNRNVNDDPSAMRELKARSGGTAIPVIDIDGKVLAAGFNGRAVVAALNESVERPRARPAPRPEVTLTLPARARGASSAT